MVEVPVGAQASLQSNAMFLRRSYDLCIQPKGNFYYCRSSASQYKQQIGTNDQHHGELASKCTLMDTKQMFINICPKYVQQLSRSHFTPKFFVSSAREKETQLSTFSGSAGSTHAAVFVFLRKAK